MVIGCEKHHNAPGVPSSPELQTEIPVKEGKTVTSRIRGARENGCTKTDGVEATCLFCYAKKMRRKKREKMAKLLNYEDRNF